MTRPSNDSSEATPVDLQTCDREPIHILGAIQPFGCLLAFSSDWILVQASQNVGDFGGGEPDDIIGTAAADFLDPDTIHAIRTRLQWLQSAGATERLFALPLFGGEPMDVAVHLAGDLIVVEAERSDTRDRVEAISLVRTMMARLRQATSLDDFFDRAARQVRSVTGYDRVMVYRFADEGSGEVIAEARNQRADSYLGLRFPASDIPRQARELYKRNVFRIIADIDAPRIPIVPQTAPTGEALDLSMSVLHAVSEIHIEYLRNMGVGASLSISIVIDGRLWGLFACHNLSPRQVSFDRRTAAELFVELFALELDNRARQASIESDAAARKIHDRVMSTIPIEGSAFENLSANLDTFATLVDADGCGVWMGDEFACVGRGVSQDEARALVRFLNRAGPSRVYATHHLSKGHPEATDYAQRVSGLLAIPVSRTPRDYLLFFRSEVARSVDWAGDPSKPVSVGPNGARLSPRKSFETWREVVRDMSRPWEPSELRIAESLRTTLLEVILRSMDQSRQVRVKAQETQDLLIAELNHRVRNILTLIRGVIHQTGERSASVAKFRTILHGRIQSLARAHDQLTSEQWAPAPLRALFMNELEAYAGDSANRVALTGREIALTPEAYTCLALVVHELATNSMKYGSLSDQRGRLDIRWEVDPTGSLVIRWQETGGPPVRAPERRGFGSSLIERAVPFELGGEATMDFELTGLRARLLVPGRFVHEVEPTDAIAEQDDGRPADEVAYHEATILLVEDNLVIAMDAEAMLDDMGFAAVKTASNTAAAIRIVEEGGIDCALLDLDLGHETSIPVAEVLRARRVPFAFASGYGDPALLPEPFRDVAIITKPYGEKRIVEALSRMMPNGSNG